MFLHFLDRQRFRQMLDFELVNHFNVHAKQALPLGSVGHGGEDAQAAPTEQTQGLTVERIQQHRQPARRPALPRLTGSVWLITTLVSDADLVERPACPQHPHNARCGGQVIAQQ